MFKKLDSTLHINKSGVGLGLAICKNLASKLGPFDKIYLNS